MNKKILSMDKTFICQNHPRMERFYPWMGKSHPHIGCFIYKASAKGFKQNGRDFKQLIDEFFSTDDTFNQWID